MDAIDVPYWSFPMSERSAGATGWRQSRIPLWPKYSAVSQSATTVPYGDIATLTPRPGPSPYPCATAAQYGRGVTFGGLSSLQIAACGRCSMRFPLFITGAGGRRSWDPRRAGCSSEDFILEALPLLGGSLSRSGLPGGTASIIPFSLCPIPHCGDGSQFGRLLGRFPAVQGRLM